MPRRILLLIVLCGLLALAVPSHAADPARWTAWMHYGRHMTLVDSNGDVLSEVDLPAPDGYGLYSKVAVSRDGKRVAYNVYNPRQVGLVVYDLFTQAVVQRYQPDEDISQTSLISPNIESFSLTNDSLAYGYLSSDLNTNSGHWHLLIINLVHGEVDAQLDTDDLAAVGEPREENGGYWTPVIRRYSGTEVVFTLLPVPDTSYNTFTYTWNILNGAIGHTYAYPMLNNWVNSDTFLPTGEVLSPYFDERFPYQTLLDFVPTVNSLHIYDPLSRSRYPFFASLWPVPYHASFVQNGQRVLVQSFNDWLLLDRDGTVVDQFKLPFAFISWNARVTPDGFLYSLLLSVEGSDGESFSPLPALYEVDTRDDKLDVGRAVWAISMNEFLSYFPSSEQAYLDIAWVHSDAPVGPFKPWAQLAEPVYEPIPSPADATITPTLIPLPPPVFHVGQTVRVQTIDGEILNLRREPTRKSEILAYMEDDTRLELLDGPVEAEGFHWWRVRTPDGLEGWVVENDGEVQTLMPE